MNKPGIPQGTRDFGPDVVRKRNYIFNTIRKVFELYGFQPLETPAFENLDTLMGKYGEEGDRLIFKILNNGLNDPKNIDKSRTAFENVLNGRLDKNLTERALKYDLTIPFARYVAMNHGQLTFPFKRYQMQPVWRADRPQKGRYREFYQCDADILGSASFINEVEFVNIYNDVFTALQMQNYRLHINNRKILKGIMEVCGLEALEKKILIIIDKTDKIGIEGVEKELKEEGIPEDQLKHLIQIYSIKGSSEDVIKQLRILLSNSKTGNEGIEEVEFVIQFINTSKGELKSKINLDLTLARGLEYYTGVIFEVKAPPEVKIGSIGGGGRYNDLTGLFGVPNIPGVGISFGVDRIYDVLEELNLFPEAVQEGTKVLFFNLGKEESSAAYKLLQEIRSQGTAAEMYPETAKFDKQFKYAEKKKIPFVIILGSKELNDKTCLVKDLRTSEQKTVSLENVSDFLFI